MSEKKSPEDIVASVIEHVGALTKVEAVMLMTQTNGKAVTRFWGNRAEVYKMAISSAARLFAEMEAQATTQDQTIIP